MLPNALTIPLPLDVIAELSDPKFIDQMHYSVSTKTQGCKGPLCGMRYRHYRRDLYEKKRHQAGKAYVPDHETRKSSRDGELLPIAAAYVVQYLENRRDAELAYLMAHDSFGILPSTFNAAAC